MFRFANRWISAVVIGVCLVSVATTTQKCEAFGRGGGFLGQKSEGEEGGCTGPLCKLFHKDQAPAEPRVVQVEVPPREPAKPEESAIPAWLIVALASPFALMFAGAASVAAYFGVRHIQQSN